MNSLNALGNRQITSLQADLAKMENGESGPSVQGSITTTLGALSRLIDDYESKARKEMVTAAREKANTRVARLKTEHRDLKARFDRAKAESQLKDRSDLLGSASSSSQSQQSSSAVQRRTSALHESPFAPSSSSQSSLWQPNHPHPNSGGSGGSGSGGREREDFALREHSFLQESENSIDNYLAQGRAVLENLVEQRGMLKGTKRRLLDAANTLGMSRETIGWVERRTSQDAWIFFGGATFTLFSFWVIWHYLG